MTAADKPRADLVALLLQFEACAASLSSMHLTGQDATRAVAAWVEMRGHRVEPETLTRCDLDGREITWTMWTVTPTSGPDWNVTCSLPDHEAAAQADQQVLARVQAALDGERNREPAPCAEGECKHAYDDWPASSVTQRDREFDQCSVCGWTEADVSRLRRIHAQERAAVESGWVELGTVKS